MKASILGYGKSGKTSLTLLQRLGYTDIDIFDDNQSLGYKNTASFKDIYDIVAVAPGIDLNKLPEKPSKVTSELELTKGFMKEGAKVIGVTGTNGKSTTTFLTSQILNKVGIKTAHCGNIGVTFGDKVFDKSIDIFVIELSSFQIDLLDNFIVNAGCIINLTPDHLDRYSTLNDYYRSKVKLTRFIADDGLFIHPSVEIIDNAIKSAKFNNIAIDEKLIVYPKLSGNILNFGDYYINLNEYKLFGIHNIINLSYAVLLASHFYKFSGDITRYISNLEGMHHRTELIFENDNNRYINDSKATNIDSVLTALKSVNKPTTLLIGGRDKKSDYTQLVDLINKNISRVIYFGEAGELIKSQIDKMLMVERVLLPTMKEAVKYVTANPIKDDTVLLSPACTSFDEFNNYEERGFKFAEYVKEFLGVKV